MQVQPMSLDGQDRDAGADYLITTSSRFALVEFKYTDLNLPEEGGKIRRLNLCQELQKAGNSKMRSMHDKCHFVAWLQNPEQELNVNVYRLEICNKEIFGSESKLSCTHPQRAGRISAETFAAEFFENSKPRTLVLGDFEKYLSWLLQNPSGSESTSLELAFRDKTSPIFRQLVFKSVRAAHDWLVANKPKPKPKISKRRRPGV